MERSLLNLTRELLDLQTEKKSYNKEINERIKELQAQIAAKAKEDSPA